MYTTQFDLSGGQHGEIKILSIARSAPRYYNLQCSRCNAQWTAPHSTVMTRVQAKLAIRCVNSGCTSGRDKQAELERLQHIEAKQKEKAQREAEHEAAMRKRYGPQEPKPVAVPLPNTKTHEAWSKYYLGALKYGFDFLISKENWLAVSEDWRVSMLSAVDHCDDESRGGLNA